LTLRLVDGSKREVTIARLSIGGSLISRSGPIRGLVTFGQTFVRRCHGATFRTGVDGARPPCRCVRLYGTGYEAWAGRRRLLPLLASQNWRYGPTFELIPPKARLS
jgi:hypothetical protein